MRRGSVLLFGFLAAAVTVSAPSVNAMASADPDFTPGTVHVDSYGGVRYTGTSRHNDIYMYSVDGKLRVYEHSSEPIRNGTGCSQVTARTVECPMPDRIVAAMEAGPDWFTMLASTRVTVFGGSGDDIYWGGLAGTVNQPVTTSVDFAGGDGNDTANYSLSNRRVLVDLDASFDDGRPDVGDTDHIDNSVENIVGSNFDDSLRGNAGANFIYGGLGRDALRGGGGDDIVDARGTVDFPDEQDTTDLSCGAGTDIIHLDSADPRNPAECEVID